MPAMKPLGSIVDIIYNGKFVIKSYGPIPGEGVRYLMDRSGRRLGIVIDIVGPTKAPYLVLMADKEWRERALTLVGTEVYPGADKNRREYGGTNGRRGKKG